MAGPNVNSAILASLLGAHTGAQVAPAGGFGGPGSALTAFPFAAMGSGVQQAAAQSQRQPMTNTPPQQLTQQQLAMRNKKRGYRFLNPRGQMVTGFFAPNEVPQGAIPLEN